MSNYLTFETERLLLRPTTEADADLLVELFNSPKWLQFIGDRKVHTIKDAQAYISQRITPVLERLGFGCYTVVRKTDGVRLGTCSLNDRQGLEEIDLGFAFLPQHEKQGYAFESARKILEAGRQVFGLDRILAITTIDNLASQRLLRKLTFRKVGHTRIPDDEELLLLFELPADPPSQ
jgi:RimJ/RimL family protein N-acetyltransferase